MLQLQHNLQQTHQEENEIMSPTAKINKGARHRKNPANLPMNLPK